MTTSLRRLAFLVSTVGTASNGQTERAVAKMMRRIGLPLNAVIPQG